MGYLKNKQTKNYFSVLGDEAAADQHQNEENLQSPPTTQDVQVSGSVDAHLDGLGAAQVNEALHTQESSSPYTTTSAQDPGYGSSIIASPGRLSSLGSPISPEQLDFDNLSLGEPVPRGPANNVPRYTAPFQRGLVSNESPYVDITAPRHAFNAHRHGPAPYARASGKFNHNSQPWSPGTSQGQQEFMIIRNAMRRQFKHAEVAKWKLPDYIVHRQASLASQARRRAHKTAANDEDAALQLDPIPSSTQQIMQKWGVFGNFDGLGNLGRVLGEQTIWCKDWENGKDEVAPWPSIAELKWEGDDRAKTGVGRFFPLPREEGPPGLPWNQLPVVDQFPMDQVALIPTMEDVYLPVDAQIEEEKEYLWSQELQDAMDDFLES